MTERGTLLGGRYELDQVIGRGGMAEVWRARDTRLQRDVAVKRLRLDLASDPTFQARFRREAQASAGLNHPNIVAVYDTGEEKDASSDVMVPYIIMELIEGVTLREVLRGGRKIVPEKALEFTAGVLDALAYSHRAGIIHRDIKPANVMFTPPGTVKVMDFGIARAVADTSATMTQTAAVIGTAQYLSPEQARGEKVDNRSDLYAVGCLLYELLVSEPPFKGDSPVSVAYQHVREIPVRPSERDPEINSDMDAIVMKALSKDPKDRYQDASEFRDDILRALDNQPVAAAIPPSAEAPTQVIASDPITTTARRAAFPAAVAGGAAAAGAGGLAHAAGNNNGNPGNLPEDIEDGELEEEKSGRGPVIAIAVLGGLLVVGLIVAVFLLMNDGPGEPAPTESPSVTASQTPEAVMVAIPTNLIGMEQADAEAALRELDLNPVVEISEAVATEDNDGTVEATDPPGGDEIEEGSDVTLFVYEFEEPETVAVPNGLVGMTQGEAEAALRAVGLVPDVRNVDGTEANAGTVESTEPGSGEEVEPGGTVVVNVYTYEAPANISIPDVAGMAQQDAIDALEAAGVEPGDIETTQANPANESPSHSEGDVVSMSPTGSVAPGGTVTLTIATGQSPVPTLTGSTVERAEQDAEAAGFTIDVEVVSTDEHPAGVVFEQNPRAGATWSRSQPITVEVAEAP
ncbi:MAG: Stk1 family PASTA domain-containing Ser/Thr kinase [Propionibacterium sp.]|nr:Stk1 family PASTA domain-containing Ser/Thr kinase [Propionibacterium sp.]